MKTVSDTIKKITSFFVKTTYSNKIATFILVVPLVIIIYLIYHYLSGMREGIVSNKEHEPSKCGSNNNEKGDATLYLFYADWCPHCTRAKEEGGPWNKFKLRHGDEMSVNNTIVSIEEIDCTDNKIDGIKTLINKYKVKGYPTIILDKDGEHFLYDTKPDPDTIEEFVKRFV